MWRIIFVCLFLAGCGGSSETPPVDEQPPPVDEYVYRTTTMFITAPEFYEDGSELYYNDISHYQVVYSDNPANLYLTYDVSVTGITMFDFTAQAGITWYVAVQTVDIYGGISDVSNTVVLEF